MRWIGITALLLALGLGWVGHNSLKLLGHSKQIKFSDNSCRLLQLPTPCEDLSALGDGHSALCGGGDIWKTFQQGSRSSAIKEGAVWLVNVTEGTVQQIPVSGASAPKRLILHGIHFSQKTRRLYAVNHDEEAGESVEVFDLVQTGAVLSLHHRVTVRSPLFGNFALNDVVEGDGDEFYVTEWQPFPFPPGGKAGMADASLLVRMQRLAVTACAMLNVKVTRVFRCAGILSDKLECNVATTQQFVMANGITISEDRQTVFVNDPPVSTINVFERLSDGTLKFVSDFKTKHALDNIEMRSDGKLDGGTIPLAHTSGTVCDQLSILAITRVVDGREVGCGKSPGSLLQISLLGTGGKSFVDGTQTEKAVHDGSKLSGVAAALNINGKVVLGGPDHPGVLVCDA